MQLSSQSVKPFKSGDQKSLYIFSAGPEACHRLSDIDNFHKIDLIIRQILNNLARDRRSQNLVAFVTENLLELHQKQRLQSVLHLLMTKQIQILFDYHIDSNAIVPLIFLKEYGQMHNAHLFYRNYMIGCLRES